MKKRVVKMQTTNLKGILDYSEKKYCLKNKSAKWALTAFQNTEVIRKGKVEKILKGSLDSIPSPSPSVKIKIMGGKVCLNVNAKHCKQKVC